MVNGILTKMMKIMNYETPEVTIVEIAVEKGFAQSSTGQLDNDFGREGW